MITNYAITFIPYREPTKTLVGGCSVCGRELYFNEDVDVGICWGCREKTQANEDSINVFRTGANKEIVTLDLSDDWLLFVFADGTMIKLLDAGQQCCEYRYMHSNDNLQYFVGSKLLGAEVRDAPDGGGEWAHEVQFLIVTTDMGSFTIETHNEHNGYYGGFSIRAIAIDREV